MAREDEIRLVAYNIWEEEGCPNGRDCEHWYRAEAIWEQQMKPQTSASSSQPESQPMAKPKNRSTRGKRK